MEQERMELWNVKDLQPPPLLRCHSPLTQIELDILMSALKEGIEYFANQQYLHRESALVSRLIYRMKTKFRSSKDFKILEKINNALLNYLQMDITRMLKTFAASVSTKSKAVGTFLPTRNLFDYVLIRFQGLGKLLVRIIDSCKIACEMHNQRMRLGHFWKIAIFIYGVSSRIFMICKNMMKFTCNLYTKLYSLRSKFANVGVKWLPSNYIQPKSLNEWLGISWEELEKTVVIEIPDEPSRITSYFNLIDDDSDIDDDIQISDEYILVKDDTMNNENFDNSTNGTKKITTLRGFDDNVDIGEVLTLSDTDNGELENNNNSVTEQNNKTSQLSEDKSQTDTNTVATTPKSAKKRVVKIIKRKKSVNKQESVINLDDSNEENVDDSVIFVGSTKPIENHSNNGSPLKKKVKKRKADQNGIAEPKKKKKKNGVISTGNQQQQQNSNTKPKKTKKTKKKIKTIKNT